MAKTQRAQLTDKVAQLGSVSPHSSRKIRTVRHWIGGLFVTDVEQYDKQNQRDEQFQHQYQLHTSQTHTAHMSTNTGTLLLV